jgi:hypothetical protein
VTDLWSGARARWESVRDAVESGGAPDNAEVGVFAPEGAPGIAINPIAVTGIAGGGKSVFYDALVQAIRSGDRDRTRSREIEKHRVRFGRGRWQQRAAVAVIPGQESQERESSLDETMRRDASPHGLVYVTCWGHNRIWQRSDQREVTDQLTADGKPLTVEAVRQWHLDKELLDFRTLVDEIIDGQLARRLRWMIVAVSKVDLYWDRLDEARDYYLPGGPKTYLPDGREKPVPFAQLLTDLELETSLRLTVLPMASRLIRHTVLPELPKLTSQLDDAQLGVLRDNFGGALQRFITHPAGDKS